MAKRTLAIITNDPDAVFQSLIIRSVRTVADPAEIALVVYRSAPQPVEFDPRQADGVLVIANAVPDKTLVEWAMQRTPISLVSHRISGAPIPTVMFNNAQGIALLVDHLVNGCLRRRIIFARGIGSQIDGAEREAAFRAELLRHHLPLYDDDFLDGEFDPDQAVKMLRARLLRGAAFDAIVAADYLMAIAMAAYLRDCGIGVPEQVAVVGFGDAQAAAAAGMTTVAADVQALGARAARQVISQMDGLRIRGVTTLNVSLMIRETCGFVRADT
jgi:LacI family transcriptional regulator